MFAGKFRIGTALGALIALLATGAIGAWQAPDAHAAVAWSFDYQGELKDGGLPVSGPTPMQFKLWNTASGGLQVGPTLSMPAVPVTAGVFTVTLDFTNGGVIAGIFDGNERYLEVIVNGTPLTPRQRLAPVPNAITAQLLNMPYAEITTAPGCFTLVQSASGVGNYVIKAQTISDDSSTCAIIGETLTESNGNGTGVLGISRNGNGFGVIGTNLSPIGNCTGVYGNVESPFGYGVLGWAASPTGPTKGVAGQVWSPDGWAGYFEGRGYFRDDVGIGVEDPGAKVEIQGAGHPSGVALNVEDRFFVGSGSNFVSIGRTTPVTASEYFGVRAPVSGNAYGGMYMETGSPTGRPFYGYAAAGGGKAWTYYDALANEWRLNTAGVDRIMVTGTSGNTGIKRSATTNDLEVEGTASKTTAGSWLANSDARIKTDVETLDGALDTLSKVRLVSFRYTGEYRDAHPEIDDRRYLNVIAQEFREVFPEWVKGSGEHLAGGEEILQVDTYPLTIFAARAVQELDAMVKERDATIATQAARVAELEERMARLETVMAAVAARDAGIAGAEAATYTPGR